MTAPCPLAPDYCLLNLDQGLGIEFIEFVECIEFVESMETRDS